jgi:cell division transport system permease protein
MRLAWREVLLAFRRSPALALLSITTIAFSLYAFGLFGLVAINIKAALRTIEDRVEIRAFVTNNAKEEQIQEVMLAARRLPQVASVGYVSPDSAMQRARAELEEFRDVMEGTLLPGSIELRLKEGARDPEVMKQIAGQLQTYGVVDDVMYGREWIEKLYRVRTIAGIAGTGLGFVFALVAVIIIGATIRMAILARTREIEVMRLVGATNGFVRLPYMMDGLLKGMVGGMIAVLLSWSTNRLVSRSFMQTEFFTAEQMLLGIVAGAMIGLLGSWISVGRHLRRVWQDR